MPRVQKLVRLGRCVALSLALGAFVYPGTSWAGELKFGAAALEVDDDGKLTKAGRAAATGTVESVAADEELWQLNLWVKIDNGAQGPVYFEFFRNHKGQRLSAYSHEYADYGGEKYVSLAIDLARDMGFRFGDKLDVEVIQIGGNDKKKVLAKGKLELAKGPEASGPSGGGGGGDAGGDEEDSEPVDEQHEQDIVDGLAGGDEDPGVAPAEPPPIAPEAKKGCRVAVSGDNPLGLAVLFALLAIGRRRRD